jgi:transaldolase
VVTDHEPSGWGRPAVFLDRDGVLNEPVVIDGRPHPPGSAADLKVGPDVVRACQQLRQAGLLLIVVTNQPDIARGTQERETVDAIHGEIRWRLPVDDLLVCPHDDGDDCSCRKPAGGLLVEGARRWGVDLRRSVMVGDRWRDVEAGRAVGCSTVFVDRGYREPTVTADLVVGGLPEAVPWILRATRARPGSEPAARSAEGLRIEIFADGADAERVAELARNPLVRGFTTNPTLMRAAGVSDYEAFARDLLAGVPHLPISFEVLAGDFDEMERQARRIASWGDSVYVKVPVTNPGGEFSGPLLRRLAAAGVRLNVTALLTLDQVRATAECVAGGPAGYISVFAGRIADTGRDPVPLMRDALDVVRRHANLQLIWASPREVLNVIQADAIGCDVITITPELFAKLPLLGMDLADLSLETVRMFDRDARAAGLTL